MIKKCFFTLTLLSLFFSYQAAAEWSAIVNHEDSTNSKALKVFENKFDANSLSENKLSPIWPLIDQSNQLLQRYGTPTMVEGNFQSHNYEFLDIHEALDVVRSSSNVSGEVYAPVSGLATMIVEEGGGDYYKSVAILNKETGFVFTLLHIAPAVDITQGKYTEVKKGDLIGELAKVPTMRPEIEGKYRHTHVIVSNMVTKKRVNPLVFFKTAYHDKVVPKIIDLKAEKKESKLELKLTVEDRDGRSSLPFEVQKIKFSIKNSNGETVKVVSSCSLDELVHNQELALKIFDLNQMSRYNIVQVGQDGPYKTNAASLNKKFIYNLHNLDSDGGVCRESIDGISVPEEVDEYVLELNVEDYHGNSTSRVIKVRL